MEDSDWKINKKKLRYLIFIKITINLFNLYLGRERERFIKRYRNTISNPNPRISRIPPNPGGRQWIKTIKSIKNKKKQFEKAKPKQDKKKIKLSEKSQKSKDPRRGIFKEITFSDKHRGTGSKRDLHSWPWCSSPAYHQLPYLFFPIPDFIFIISIFLYFLPSKNTEREGSVVRESEREKLTKG